MELTKQRILEVARLARLKLRDDEIERFVKELNEILLYLRRVEALAVGEELSYPRALVMEARVDEAKAFEESSALRSAFCRREGGYMKAPRSL